MDSTIPCHYCWRQQFHTTRYIIDYVWPETGHLGGQIDMYQSHWNNKCFLVLQATNGH